MAKKVVGREMTSKVGLDSAEAVKSLKQLTAEVKANTSGWKAQETALKSAGEYQKAAAARVDGLAKSMESQKAKIDELKSRQSGLNRNTKDGEEAYLKLSDQINKANRSYDSMGGQLDRAKSKLQYYNSGLADLQKGYKQSTALSESYVKRLEAEGRSAEANKAKLGGLKQVYSNMEAQYKAQTSELERIKNASGATSDAYKRQQVRVNETATAMAKAKTSQKELVKAMEKEPHGFMSGVRSKLDSVDDKAKKTSHLFGTILGAHLVANGITNVLSSITSSFGELTSAVTEYDNKQRTMTSTWETLTGSAGKGKQMVNIGNDLASAFNQNINVVDELNQSFYHVFDNAPRTKELTKSILTLGDTLNLSDENVTRLGTNFTHMLSSGKMQLGDFNMINDQLPMYAGKMLEFEKKQQHNSKLTMSTLRDQMSAGKISAKDAEEVMNSLGGKYAKASENLMKTIPGMERSIKTQMPALLDAVYKPIANMKSPLMGQFTKWIGNKNTKTEFKNVGDALAMQINDITKAFAGKNFNVGDTLDKMLSNLAKGIDKVGANIVAHKKEIKSFFSSMKTASKTSFNVFVQSLKDIEPILKIVGGFAEKHPKVFAGLASSAFVASKSISALKLAFSGLDLAKGALGGIGGKLSRLVFKPKVDGTEGKRELTKFASFVKRKGTGMGRWLKKTASVTTTKAKGALSSMWKHTKSVGGKIGRGLKWTAKIAYKGASKAFRVLGAGIKKLGKAFLSLGRLLLTNPIGLVVTAVVALGVAFYEAYKHIKPFRQWVNKAFKSVVNFGKGIAKWGSKVGKSIGRALRNMSKKWNGFKKSFKKSWNNTWNSVKKFFSNIFNGIHKKFKSWVKTISKYWKSFSKLFKKAWNSYWNFIHDFYAGIFKKIAKVFKSWTTAISKTWSGLKRWFNKSWKGMWNGVHDFFHGITKKLSKTFSNWTSGTMNALGSFGNKFKSGWNGIVTGVKNIFSGLWKEMKKMASDGINGVIDIVNKGIGGVNWVINKFGGSKQTIKPIGHVHFATGTGSLGSSNFRRAINSITPAVVNDEAGASNPELIFRKSTGTVEYSKKKNAETMLFPGDEVANATDSARLAPMLGITHFAGGGIGDFFGGIINGAKSVFKKIASGLKGLFDVGTKIISNPGKALESLMSFSKGNTKGFFPTIAKGGFDFVKKQAGKWWSNLWDMVSLSGDGSGSYGGGWQSPGGGWSHTDSFGSSRGGGHVHDGNDFSASVGTAFHAMHGGTVIRVGNPPAGWGDVGYNIVTRDSTGKEIIYQEFGNAKDVRVHKGQHVKTGDVLGKLGRSGLGTGPHLHVGLTNGGSVWNRGGYSTKGWLDITKQHGKDKGSDADSDSSSSGNSSLQKMIKKQVGGGFWKTISKIASMFGDDGGSGNSPSGHMSMGNFTSIAHQAANIAGVKLSANDIKRLYWQAHVESGVNPATGGGYNDHDGTGLPIGLFQYKKGTWNAWAKAGHKNIHSALDQVIAVIRDSNWRSDLAPYGVTRGWGPTGHKKFANGGIINTNQLIEVAEHNKPEMVLPLTNKSRANQLIAQASQVVNGNNGSQVVPTDSESSKKLDKLISLMSAILGNMGNVQAVIAKSDVVNAVKSDSKTALQYSQMMGY